MPTQFKPRKSRPRTADRNLCPNCGRASPLSSSHCGKCGTTLVQPTLGTVAFWLLGEVDLQVVHALAERVGRALGVPVTIQPGRLDPGPSERPMWNGRSGTVILNQLLRRHRPGCLTNVAIVSDNIVSSAADNWLFGYAYVGLEAACMSLYPLLTDNPSPETLLHRAKSICLHEIGHTLELDDHPYGSHPDCCMLGEVSQDSLYLTDAYSSDFCPTCLATARRKLREYGESIDGSVFVPDVGALFAGRDRLKRIAGIGGMGVVWKARDLHLAQDVALKFVKTRGFDGPALVRLTDEAARARRLSHPGIVRVFDCVREGGISCLVMDWVSGTDLETKRQARLGAGTGPKVYDPDEIRDWAGQLCRALSHAHSRGIVHHDVKPGNCMVGDDGGLTVLDFGLSRVASAPVDRGIRSSRSGGGGTPGFGAPEQFRRTSGEIGQDLYGLGATLYALLAGLPPRIEPGPFGPRNCLDLIPLNDLRRRMQPGAAPVPPRWEATINACLAIDPADRPSTVADVAAALGLADKVAAAPTPPASGFRRWWQAFAGTRTPRP